MFELGHLMALGPAAVVPALDYLFHRVEGQFDGRPTLLILDEAWLFLAHPVFMRRVAMMPSALALFAEGCLPRVGGAPVEVTIAGRTLGPMVLTEVHCGGEDYRYDVAVLVFRPATIEPAG
jgi:hypothetical protein